MRFDRVKLLGRGCHLILTALSPVGLSQARSSILAFSSTTVASLGDGAEIRLGDSMEDVASRRRMLPANGQAGQIAGG